MPPRSQLTEDLTRRIIGYLREGRSASWIAVTIDVDRRTLSRWIERGRKQTSGPHHELAMVYDDLRAREAPRSRAEVVDADGNVSEVTLKPAETTGGHKRRAHTYADASLPEGVRGELRPTEELTARLSKLVSAGNFLETAAAVCGVPRKTAFEWLQRGRMGEPHYAEFFQAIDRASAECEARDTLTLQRLTQSNEERVALEAIKHRGKHLSPQRWGDVLPADARKVFETVLMVVEECAPPEVYASILDRLSRLGGRASEVAGSGPVAGHLPMAK